MGEKDLLILSIKELLTKKMLSFSLLPLVLSGVIVYGLFFVFAGIGLSELGVWDIHTTSTTIENGVENTDTLSAVLEGSSIIQFLMSYSLTSSIASFFVYTIGSFLALYVSIFVAVIVIGSLTPYIIKHLHNKYYQDVEMIGYSGLVSSLVLTIKWAFTMLVLFFALIPFYFIP